MKKTKPACPNAIAIMFCTIAWLPTANAADNPQAKNKHDFSIKPVVMDSKNLPGSTVGLEYVAKGVLTERSFDTKDAGSTLVDPNATIGALKISYQLNGTIAASKLRNPKNLLESALDAKLLYSTAAGTVSGGAFMKYESDQSFQNKQSVYGIRGTAAKYSVLGANDFVALDLNYGRVDPKDDAARKAVLGASPLSAYYRWDLEFLYMVPTKWKMVPMVEFNYRHFKESGPPAPVAQANLDVFKLATVRFSLPSDMFIAYSAGKLPFSLKNDQLVQLGWSYKLQ